MPIASFGCSRCGKQAPKKLRAHGQFANRMSWLRRHLRRAHPVIFKRSIAKGVATRRKL